MFVHISSEDSCFPLRNHNCDRLQNWPQNLPVPECSLLCFVTKWSVCLHLLKLSWPCDLLWSTGHKQNVSGRSLKALVLWGLPTCCSWNPEIAVGKSPSYPSGAGGTIWRRTKTSLLPANQLPEIPVRPS